MAVHHANTLDMVADFTQGVDRIDLHLINQDSVAGVGDLIWDGLDTDGQGHGGQGNGGQGNSGQGHLGYHMEQVDTDWRTIIDGYKDGGPNGSDHSFDFHISLRGHIDLKQSDFIL
jgi:hypothetical protein